MEIFSPSRGKGSVTYYVLNLCWFC